MWIVRNKIVFVFVWLLFSICFVSSKLQVSVLQCSGEFAITLSNFSGSQHSLSSSSFVVVRSFIMQQSSEKTILLGPFILSNYDLKKI